MNKPALIVAAGFLMAAGLAGCSSDKAPPPPAPVPVAAPAPPPPPPPPPAPTYKSAQQQHAAQLQTALNANGAHLEVDGKMGPGTRAALKSYQAEHHLKATGKPDAATLKALGLS